MKKIAIIGTRFSSASTACYLAQAGNAITMFEKSEAIGARADQFKKYGLSFGIRPLFYWLPDVFNRFFAHFNRNTFDYHEFPILRNNELNEDTKKKFDKDIDEDLSVVLERFELLHKNSKNGMYTAYISYGKLTIKINSAPVEKLNKRIRIPNRVKFRALISIYAINKLALA